MSASSTEQQRKLIEVIEKPQATAYFGQQEWCKRQCDFEYMGSRDVNICAAYTNTVFALPQLGVPLFEPAHKCWNVTSWSSQLVASILYSRRACAHFYLRTFETLATESG